MLVCLTAMLALAVTAYGSAPLSTPMLRDYALHIVFWVPPGAKFPSGVESGILRMETDIQTALAAGQDDNIYAVPGAYSDASGPGDPRIASIDTTTDTASYPTGTACQHAPPPCVTDTQINQEVVSLAASRSWVPGTHTLVLVVLAPQVAACISQGPSPPLCTTGKLGGYHSTAEWTGPGTGYPYGMIPENGNDGLDPSDPQGPIAHEQNEAIVNSYGGNPEIADPCNNSGSNYINRHRYSVPGLRLPSGKCVLSPVTPILNAHFSVRQVRVKGGTLVTFTPARNEDSGGDLVYDKWSGITRKVIEGGGKPVTHLFTKPGKYSIEHEIVDASATATVVQTFTVRPKRR